VYRRYANGANVTAEYKQRGSFMRDVNSDSDDEDYETDEEDEDKDIGDESDSDDEYRPRSNQVGKESVPQIFRRKGAQGSATAKTADARAYSNPRLIQVSGIHSKPEKFQHDKKFTEHFSNVLVSFARLVEKLIVKNKEGDDSNGKMIRYSAIVRLRAGHWVYRERLMNAEFDIFETHGRRERANEVLSFEKRFPATDDDVTIDVLPYALGPASLPVSL
jgi:hypothetical protein